jgi:hypothetical protein
MSELAFIKCVNCVCVCVRVYVSVCHPHISMLKMKIFTQAVETTHFILIPANKESDQNMKTNQCV